MPNELKELEANLGAATAFLNGINRSTEKAVEPEEKAVKPDEKVEKALDCDEAEKAVDAEEAEKAVKEEEESEKGAMPAALKKALEEKGDKEDKKEKSFLALIAAEVEKGVAAALEGQLGQRLIAVEKGVASTQAFEIEAGAYLKHLTAQSVETQKSVEKVLDTPVARATIGALATEKSAVVQNINIVPLRKYLVDRMPSDHDAGRRAGIIQAAEKGLFSVLDDFGVPLAVRKEMGVN